VLVTGATGFIGSNVVRALLKEGFQVRALVRANSNRLGLHGLPVEEAVGDLRDRESLRRALKGCQALFHVGAMYVFWCANRREIYESNVAGTRNALQAALEEGVEKVVHTSSIAAIGLDSNGTPASENTRLDPRVLTDDYHISKFLAEQEVAEFVKKGLPVVIVNPSAPMGPWDVKPTPTGRIVVDFMKGRLPAYIDTGLNVVDVEDVAMGHLLAFHKGRAGERYILGGRNVTLLELLRLLAQITGRRAPSIKVPLWLLMVMAYADQSLRGDLLRKPPLITVGVAKRADQRRWFSSNKAIAELGFPQSPIESALEKSVRWFREYGYA